MKISKEVRRKQLKDYYKIRDEQYDIAGNGFFFAFSNKQFEENKIGKEPFVSHGNGMYSSKDGANERVRHLNNYGKNKNQKIKDSIHSYVYFDYEFGNHECVYTGEYDEAYELTKDVYGKEEADKIINDREYIQHLFKLHECF